jgi:hypothetical protein
MNFLLNWVEARFLRAVLWVKFLNEERDVSAPVGLYFQFHRYDERACAFRTMAAATSQMCDRAAKSS